MARDPEPSILGGRLGTEWVIIGILVVLLVVAMLAVRSSVAEDRAIARRSSTTSTTSPLVPGTTDAQVPGVQVDIAPEPSGDVRVTEVVHSPSPLASLDIRPPPPASSRSLGISPRVVDLKVEVGDLRIPAAIPTAVGHSTIELPARSTEVRLTYLLLGATSQHRTARAGRALVQVHPLSHNVGAGDGLVTTKVEGVVVHNLVCPDLPVDEQLCGREDATGWQTTPVPAGSATVLAQIDLPLR